MDGCRGSDPKVHRVRSEVKHLRLVHEARDVTLHHSLGATVIQFSALVLNLLEGVFDIILESIWVALIFSLRRHDTATFSRAFIHYLRSI